MSTLLHKNNVKITGNGDQAMIFVHGFGCDQNMWRFVAPSFENDYKVVLLDLVGAGGSDARYYNKQKYDTLTGHAQDIIDLCEFLNLNDIIFVGHSVSAMIGALVDIHQPGLIEKLVMIGPSPCYINDENYHGGFDQKDIEELLEAMDINYLGWSSSLAPVIMGNADKPELGNELKESFCKTDPEIAQEFAKVTFLSDNRADLHRIKADCLILQCQEDIIAPETVGEYLKEKIPSNSYTVLDATGHCPHMSAPEETIAAITDFLEL
ncbi:alpha/beta fold hydrolase [Portibacter marinus]|uniref:alpha/beta fold hydrolase n=1 Tax=Portibacter marinus TaxID=2898660 RepID=UPI001F3E86B3|nr:alpha/beta hydrolase [Portibacter marinus]